MSDRIGSILKNLQKEASKGGEPFYADNIGEILKNKKKKQKKAEYAGAFLDKTNEKALYNWWKLYTKKDILKNKPEHPHMTIKFRPSEEQVLALPVGESEDVKLTITGVGFDENTQAVRVRINDSSIEVADDKVPHITISWSDDSRAANSNDLLKNHTIEVADGLELSAKIGLFLRNRQVVYDLTGTIYDEDVLSDDQISVKTIE